MSSATGFRPRIFNTAFESGLRSLVLLTVCYPQVIGLDKLVILDHLMVHSGDVDGPISLHPSENSRTAELLVRRRLIDSGLSLMGTKRLVIRHATLNGFRYQAGEDAGTFVDFLRSQYMSELKLRAQWVRERIVPMTDEELAQLVRNRMDQWTAEFQSESGYTG